MQAFGNLTVNTGGTYTSNTGTVTTSARWTYLGGNLTNDGTVTVNGATTTTLLFTGGAASTVSGIGTYTGGIIPQIYHQNSAGTTYNSPIVVRNAIYLVEGPVTPNGNLTVGLASPATAITIYRNARSFFTARPLYPTLGTQSRNVYYGGTINGNMQQAQLGRDTIFTGFELDSIANGESICIGTMTINTMDHIRTTTPVRVGSATVGGATTFSRGIVFTSTANPLIIGQLGNGATGIAPTTTNPPITQGSFVVGPMRFDRNTTSSTAITVPLGVGGSYLQSTTNSNHLKTVILTPGGVWNNQTLIFRQVGAPGGTVDTGLTTTMGDKTYFIDLNGGNDIPTTATITLRASNYLLGNSDNLFGNINQLFVGQSTAQTGAMWKRRSLASATTTGFVNNTIYTFTSTTAAPFGPISPLGTNGGYFTFVSNAGLMTISGTTIDRTIDPVSIGSGNNVMLRIKVTAAGQVPKELTQLNFNTTGTSRLASIAGAKVFFTGASATFGTTSQFGTSVTSPSGAFSVSGSQTLAAGDNYFWLVYDVASSAILGDSLAAECPSLVFNGATSTITAPAAGYRIVSAPMTFVSASATQSVTSKVEQNSTNNQILDIQVVMSATGAPIPLTQIDLNTNGGGANPTNKIANAKLYYTGATNSFSTSNLVGTTVSPNGAFNITGNMNLLNGTNYFWVAYDIVSNAPIGDSVDCEISSLTIGGVNQTLSSAPAGVRIIRAPYCTAGATSTADEEIWNVTFGTLNNTTTCTSVGGPGSTNSMYNNYTALPAPNIPAGLAMPMSILGGSCGGNYPSRVSVYIDINQDGDFLDAGELVLSPPSATSSNSVGTLFTGTVTLPCSSNVGLTRMRVIYNEITGITPSCGTFTWGEVEDYTINIVNAPASLTSTTAIQITGNTSSGTLDVPILRVPVRVSATPCLPGVITELRFNTAGTTSTGDIVNAKLYKTGNSNVFSTANLLATIASPSGQMVFTLADTVVNDTNNYWLAYDVSASAINNNLLDARYDSVQAFGAYYSPVVSAPAGNRVIATPMSYVSSNAVHTRLDMVETNSTNNILLRIMVRTSSTGAAINATQLNLSTNGGGNDLSNIAGIKVWYTGASSTFATTNQFGTTFVPIANGAAYSVSGTQPLNNDTNYFWVTYDIKPTGTAVLGDSVDAELASVVIAGVTQIPTTSAPAGVRKIRQPYCTSAATTTADGEILNVSIGTFSNTSTCATTGGPGSTLNMYSNYTQTVAPITIVAGLPTSFSIHAATCGGQYNGYVSIFIDYNNDGDFVDAGENVHTSPSFLYGNGVFRTGSFTVPCTATSEPTRMRVMLVEGTVPTPCLSYGFGETEDYTVQIVNSPATYSSSTAIQRTGTVSAGTLDVPVLRVPVKVTATPCLPGIVSELRFSTTGTTSAANITAAKLYTTGNSNVFNTNKLIGTVNSPSGQFIFTVSDTVVNDTNNYWLAYDVATGAANGNFLDATFDSINAFGAYYVPSASNPSGNLVVSTPMTYNSSDVIHPVLSKVETNSTNNQMLRIVVNTGATGAPINVTQLNLSTNGGGIDTSNIAGIKVWYTGSSNTFAAVNQFGTTYVPTASGSYSVSGAQPLVNGANYFWVTYDIKGTAILGDSVDAELASMVIAGVTQVPTTTAPAGRREIRAPYCTSNATTNFYHEITNVTFGTLNNTSTCTTVAPGLGSSASTYANYQGLTAPNIGKGIPVPISVTGFDCSGFALDGRLAVFIDLNQNGLLTDPGEMVYLSATAPQPASANRIMTGDITIPCT
ncbi:MAG: beta strand repeat-containing protein, partial [Dolichospermum sp.]